MAIRKSPGMQPTLICTIFPNVGRDQPLCLETIWEETTNSTSNKSWKTLKSVRKMHKKMNNSSKTETNNDMIKLNITEFKTVLLEKVLLKKNPTKYQQENQKKVWDVSGVLSSIQKKGPNFTYKLMRCSNTIHLRSVINSINLRRYHDPETTLLSLSYNTENQLTKDI